MFVVEYEKSFWIDLQGRSSVGLEFLIVNQKVAGSSPVAPAKFFDSVEVAQLA